MVSTKLNFFALSFMVRKSDLTDPEGIHIQNDLVKHPHPIFLSTIVTTCDDVRMVTQKRGLVISWRLVV